MSNTLRIPSYRRHKPTGKAVVTIAGRDIYLGKYNSAESRQEYNRLIAEWTAHNGTLPKPTDDLTVAELLAAFLKYAKGYHRPKEQEKIGFAMRPVKELYGKIRVADFGPLSLKAVRQTMIAADLARGTINSRINRIRHIFKWGVENELVPPSVLHGLQAVAGLRFGRSAARETEPVKPVPEAFIDAVLSYVSTVVAAFAQKQNCVIVATSSLELGLDVGDLDRVIQIDAPATVSSFLQRMGRTGRRAGILSFGPEGEAEYGRKNFLEILSVFTSPPLFRVISGQKELGNVHESTFYKKQDGPVILVLAGRNWMTNHLDWNRRIAYVEPTDEKGRSRWIGEGQFLSFRVCQAIRRVLAAETTEPYWSQRAKAQIGEIRIEYSIAGVPVWL